MNKPSQFTVLMLLISSFAGAPLACADGQSNRHSYANSYNNTFSFEQHASDYTDATWTPDNEIEISAASLQSLVPTNTSQDLAKKNSQAQQLQYKALLSDKSFGIAASFSF